MDKIEKYRDLIENILSEHANQPYSHDEIETKTVFDRKNDCYLLFDVGWRKKRFRVHGILVSVEIINGKFWIQYDGIEGGIVAELEESGVPKSDIVLAFHEPELRKHTEYAIA